MDKEWRYNDDAYQIYKYKVLPKCQYCSRTFNYESLKVHEKGCSKKPKDKTYFDEFFEEKEMIRPKALLCIFSLIKVVYVEDNMGQKVLKFTILSAFKSSKMMSLWDAPILRIEGKLHNLLQNRSNFSIQNNNGTAMKSSNSIKWQWADIEMKAWWNATIVSENSYPNRWINIWKTAFLSTEISIQKHI